MSKPVLEIKDFNVDFWVDGVWYPAVIGMNLSLEPGKVTAIVGESGSGKSTTALGLMSLLASNARMSGSVKVKDQEMLNAKAITLRKFRGKEVAYIFQEPMTALNPMFFSLMRASRSLIQPKRSLLLGILLRKSKPDTACPFKSEGRVTTPGPPQLRVVDTVEECTKVIFFPVLILPDVWVTLLRVTRGYVLTWPSFEERTSFPAKPVSLRSSVITPVCTSSQH